MYLEYCVLVLGGMFLIGKMLAWLIEHNHRLAQLREEHTQEVIETAVRAVFLSPQYKAIREHYCTTEAHMEGTDREILFRMAVQLARTWLLQKYRLHLYEMITSAELDIVVRRITDVVKGELLEVREIENRYFGRSE